MRRIQLPFLRQNKAVSTAISALIITAVTATLVMAVAMYAYHVLEQQRGAAEFEVAKKSILAFDDALQDAAWKLGASRAARFNVDFGSLVLIPDAMNLTVIATIGGSNYTLGSVLTGSVRYSTSNRYISFGENYKSYVLGDSDLVVTDSTESLGRALVEQNPALVDITLSYRVRAMRTVYLNVNGTWVNYVSIWLIRVVTSSSTHLHDFDLKAKSLSIQTNTIDPGVSVTSNCIISVESSSESGSATVSLDSGKVIFNVRVAEVKVSV